MTIMKRVVDALRASGNAAVADELQDMIGKLGSSFKELDALNKRKDATVRELIFTMQSRCGHFQWYLVNRNVESDPQTWGPEGTIACFECGHTVCDERAYAFGKRIREGDYFIYSHANGRRFTLSPMLKKQLGDKLAVRRIKDDGDEEGLRGAGDSNGESQTTGGMHDNSSGAERYPAQGNAQGDGRSVAGTDQTSVPSAAADQPEIQGRDLHRLDQ